MSDSKRTGKAMLFSEEGGAAVGAVSYAMGPMGTDLTLTTRLSAQPQQAVLQRGADRGYGCLKPMALDGPLHAGESDLAALWVLCAGKPAAFARLSSAAFDKTRARAALDAALRPAQPAPARPAPPPAICIEKPAVPDAAPSAAAPETPVETSAEPANEAPALTASVADGATGSKPIGFDMQTPGGGAAAPSFRGRLSPYGLPEEPDALPGAAAFEIVQPLRTAELAAAPAEQQEEPRTQPEVIAPSAPRTGITIKRAAPVSLPRDTPLWADIEPRVEAMLEALPSAQPFAAATDSARFAALPLEGAVQCYIGSVVVGGVKVLLQAVPARPFHRPAGFDHTLVSRDGDSFWVRYEIEDMPG